MLKRLSKEDIPLNEPLPWTLVDKNGYLLMQQGQLISVPQHLDNLIGRGVYIVVRSDQEEREKEKREQAVVETEALARGSAVFKRASQHVESLGVLLEHAVFHPATQSNFCAQITDMAKQLLRVMTFDADVLIAAAHLDRHSPYRVAHQYLGALLCAGLAPLLEFSPEESLSLVCAALTRDLGLIELDEELAAEVELTEELRQKISLHSLRSAEILRAHGVDDPSWIDSVIHHHERLDGSGYPAKYAGKDLTPSARLLGLVDAYSAQVIRSPRRRPNFPANALRELFLAGHTHFDPKQIGMMVKFLTRYPPGSLFKFGEGEVAIVLTRQHGTSLDAWILFDENGMPILTPRAVRLTNPDKQIRAMVAIDDFRSATFMLNKLWGRRSEAQVI